MDKPSNPQVFPWVKDGETPVTLRDLFAAAALAGFSAHPELGNGIDDERAARLAYSQADAMLREREEGRDG